MMRDMTALSCLESKVQVALKISENKAKNKLKQESETFQPKLSHTMFMLTIQLKNIHDKGG